MSDDIVRYRQEEVHLGGGDVEYRYVESKDGWIASYTEAKAALDAQAAEIARLRAACDASEERVRAIELRFWQTVDRDGLTGLPSDMWAALKQLVQDRAELATARREGMKEAAQRLEELHKNNGYNPQTGEVWRLGKLITCPLTIDHAMGYYRAIAEGVAHIFRAAAKEEK